MTLDEFRRARSAQKHDAILAAAREIFSRDGYAGASMEEIARGAGVSTATLYRHFPAKPDLFEAVAVKALDEFETALDEGAENPEIRMRALARGYAALLVQPDTRRLMRMLISETERNKALADMFYEAIKLRIANVFAAAFADGVTKKVFVSCDDAALPGGQVQGMIEHATLMRGLILGDKVEEIVPSQMIADEAFTTWSARWRR